MTSPKTIANQSYPKDEARVRYIYLVTMVAAVGGFIFGFDLSLISGAILFLKTDLALTPFWFGVVASSAILGCPFGPLAGVWLADTLGRRITLFLAAILFMLSAVGCTFAMGMVDLIVWRFVGGMGVGLASTVSPMYIAEIAPAHLRGRLLVVNQLSLVIGLTLAVFTTYFLSFGGHWRLMFASEIPPILFLMIGLVFVPRSPRWLAAKKRTSEALMVLAKINGSEQAEIELNNIEEELGEETGDFGELLRPGVRMALIIGVILMVFSQINGVNMILVYTPTIFLEAGVTSAPNAILNTVYIDGWIIFCTVITFWLIRSFGRRSILIGGAIGMAVGHLMMFLILVCHLPTMFLLVAMLIPTGAFTLTLAPLSWVVLSEIFPNRIRGKAMSLATFVMFISSYLTASFFPLVMEWFNNRFGHPGGVFLLFSGICILCALFVWRILPETKDRSLEEISEFWLCPRSTYAKKGPF